MSFGKKLLTWKTYITNKALSIIIQVQIIDKKNFFIAALDINSKTFAVHVAIWKQKKILVHSKKHAQVGAVLFDKAPTKISAKYSNYNDIFSIENVAEFLKNTRINKYAIKLKEGKQLAFKLIYSLKLVKLEFLKTYIKINLANGFIWPSIFPAKAFILFDKKLDGNLHLCVDYWSFNNSTIKNWYLLLVIDKSVDWLNLTKQFTQLDLTNTYHQMKICKDNQ